MRKAQICSQCRIGKTGSTVGDAVGISAFGISPMMGSSFRFIIAAVSNGIIDDIDTGTGSIGRTRRKGNGCAAIGTQAELVAD